MTSGYWRTLALKTAHRNPMFILNQQHIVFNPTFLMATVEHAQQYEEAWEGGYFYIAMDLYAGYF